jgi:hypothetical protein
LVTLPGILLPTPDAAAPAFNELGCLSCDKPFVEGGFNPDLLAGENTGICEAGILEVTDFGESTLSIASAGAEVDVDAGGMDGDGLLKMNDFVPLMIGKGKGGGFAVEGLGGGAKGRSSGGGTGRNINLLIAPKILGGLRPLGSVGSSSSSSCARCV